MIKKNEPLHLMQTHHKLCTDIYTFLQDNLSLWDKKSLEEKIFTCQEDLKKISQTFLIPERAFENARSLYESIEEAMTKQKELIGRMAAHEKAFLSYAHTCLKSESLPPKCLM